MTLQRVTNSIIVADIGTVWTRALLIERVAGRFRVMAVGEAPTTSAPPYSDVWIGLQNALRVLQIWSRRDLLDNEGAIILPEAPEWRGADLLLLTTSAAPALKVAVGGLMSRVSVASAARAAHSTYSEITHQFALDAPEGRWGTEQGVPGVVAALLDNFPDAVILAGGAEGSNDHNLLELVEGIALAVGAAQAQPALIFAGNSTIQEAIQQKFTPHPVTISENLRPTPEREQLHATTKILHKKLRESRINGIPGIEKIKAMGAEAPIPTIEAFAHLVEYLALRHEQSVLGVDIGAGALSLVATFEDGVSQSTVRRDLGLSNPAGALAPDELLAWVALDDTQETIYNHWLNMALAPAQMSTDDASLAILAGSARALLHAMVRDAGAVWRNAGSPRFDIVLGTGRAIREAVRPAQALSLLLDGIQPEGITRFFRDRRGTSAAIGALAEYAPTIAAALLESENFESLGSVIAPIGAANPGEEIIRFRVKQSDGSTEGVVAAGELFTVPTRQATELSIQPARHMDIGFGKGVGATLFGEGDSVGFVIDGRGRPLWLPTDPLERRATLQEWSRYVGA